jgi:hypothetical protein
MLFFQKKPGPVFLEILHSALEIRRDMVGELTKGQGDAARWREDYPVLARYFSPQGLVSVLDRLLTASKESGAYELTDYHWLVVYDCLEEYCDVVNDDASMSPDRMSTVGPYRIGRIDLDHLVEWFFWDIDFLHRDEIVGMGGDWREEHLISPEAYGIAAGLAPHPSELAIRPLAEISNWDEAEDEPAGGVIPLYPPESEVAE